MRDYKRIESDLFTCIIYFSYMPNTEHVHVNEFCDVADFFCYLTFLKDI